MRWRGATVLTNTPPRSAQSSPGGMQGIVIMEPVIAKAARKLGLDQVAIRRINCPEGKAPFGAAVQGKRPICDKCVPEGSARPGGGTVQMERKGLAHPEADRYKGAWCRRVAQLFCRWHGGLRRDPGHQARCRVSIRSGIGNLGTESVIDVHRVAAEVLGVPWEKCESHGATRRRTFPLPAFPAEVRRPTQ